MNLIDIRTKLEQCWNINTTTSSIWNTDSRSIGQDLVSSLLIQHLNGGDILYAEITTPDNKTLPHFWNNIDGFDIDLTWQQFPVRSKVGETTPIFREAILSDKDILHKYELLSHSFMHMEATQSMKH